MAEDSASKVLAILRDAAASIRRYEAQAQDALYARGDKAAYGELLLAKARLLESLPDLTAPAVAGLAPGLRSEVEEAMLGYAQRAKMAQKVGSVFFMAQLLYPDDYKDGEPNDLEEYIEELAGLLA